MSSQFSGRGLFGFGRFDLDSRGGLGEWCRVVEGLHLRLSDFIQRIDVHRREEVIRVWRNWLRGGSSCSSLQVAQTGLGAPAPFLQCDPLSTPRGSRVLADPARIDEEFRKAWLPYYCRSGQGETSLEEFTHEVEVGCLSSRRLLCRGFLGRCLLRLFIVRALLLVVWMAGIGGSSRLCWLPGLMVLLVSCLRWSIEGLLDAYLAMIPKTDGDATPFRQWPLGVLPTAYRIRASARMLQLEDWFQSWVLDSVFSAGGGRCSVEAWYSAALDVEEMLSGVADSDVHLFVSDVIKSLDTADMGILDKVLSSLGASWLVSPCLL